MQKHSEEMESSFKEIVEQQRCVIDEWKKLFLELKETNELRVNAYNDLKIRYEQVCVSNALLKQQAKV
jgi:hypothetical protein